MHTTIYLIRHSELLKPKPINIINNDEFQVWNEKGVLSVEGEKKAILLSRWPELKDIDIVISSNYVRAISTAKYIAYENNINLYIMDTFGERKLGIKEGEALPEDFARRQIQNPEYKLSDGESQLDVGNRMYDSLMKILNGNKGKRIAIVSHGTAIMFLLMKLGYIKSNNIYFNDKIIVESLFKWKAPDVFKLEYNDDTLIDIEHLEF